MKLTSPKDWIKRHAEDLYDRVVEWLDRIRTPADYDPILDDALQILWPSHIIKDMAGMGLPLRARRKVAKLVADDYLYTSITSDLSAALSTVIEYRLVEMLRGEYRDDRSLILKFLPVFEKNLKQRGIADIREAAKDLKEILKRNKWIRELKPWKRPLRKALSPEELEAILGRVNEID